MTLGLISAALATLFPGPGEQRSIAGAEATRAMTDSVGARVVARPGPAGPRKGSPALTEGPVPPTLIWAHDEPVSIPRSVSLGAPGAGAWVGQGVNDRRAQRFPVPGWGAPALEVPLEPESPARVSAAADTDAAVVLDHDGSSFRLRGLGAGGHELWSVGFAGAFTTADAHAAHLSRNGSIAAVFLTDPAGVSELFILNGLDGAITRTVVFAGPGGSVDLTDDGSLCLVAHGGVGRVIDTEHGTEVFSAPASGAGGRHRISGDGSTLVLAGFDLRVYTRSGSTWSLEIHFEQPGWWFGWGAAVSRDGLTVGVMSHDVAGGYLRTAARVFDVPTGALLGTHLTQGSGEWEDVVSGAAMSDDGAVLAACSWGTQDGAHPEVMVFDRSANLVASLDTAGSPFALDLSRDGRFVGVGSKSVHANVFGHGGTISLLENPWACRADCDGQGGLDVSDFGCFQNRFVLGLPGADCNADGVLTTADFACFQERFLAGCR